MLKIWGRANSLNVQKVLWCCDELGVEYERMDVGGPFGGNRDPEYLAMNPNALVPTISDDGFILWESNAILRYLCARHGAGTLYPEDLQRRADADRWMDWQLATLWAALRPVFVGLIKLPPEERDDAAIERARQSTAAAWEIAEKHLESRSYMLGEDFTMADIPLGACIYRWLQLPVERPPTPNLEAYHERLAERPAFRDKVMLPLT